MRSIKVYLTALVSALACLPALAQTSNPATTKPNQNTQPANSTDKSVSTNSNTNTNNAAPTRTDSVVTIPKEGTSITTAPGTKKDKTSVENTPAKNKKTTPK